MSVNSKEIFTDRAKEYADYRPSYAMAVYEELANYVQPPATAVDIGAGTGIFSRGLLQAGYKTISVEPNEAMRRQAQTGVLAADYEVVAGGGENTNLPALVADLITVAQAFHWLEPEMAQKEFRRIGKPGCITAVIWNARQFETSLFMREFRRLVLELGTDYCSMKSHWKNLDVRVREFFPSNPDYYEFPNPQIIFKEVLIGNVLSTSYAPKAGTEERAALIDVINNLFDRFAEKATVRFELLTKMYVGRLS